MPTFDITMSRKVIASASVRIEAESEDAARALMEARLNEGDVEDIEWEDQEAEAGVEFVEEIAPCTRCGVHDSQTYSDLCAACVRLIPGMA